MATFSPKRAASVLIILLIAFAALVGRVAWLQTIGRQQSIRRADRQQHQTEVLPARRGCVYDCHGILMAGTVQTETLYVDPKFMQDSFQEDGRSLVEMDDAVDNLARLVHKKSTEISQLLSDRSESRFVKVAENLDESTAEEIQKLNLPGVGIIATEQRYYPMKSLASHLLGGVGKDGKGLEGLELKWEKELAGSNGYQKVLKDARRRPIAVAAEDYQPPRHGTTLVLTIDSNIQAIAEEELARTCIDHGAKHGEVVVMDPRNGKILALANWPTFDAGQTESVPLEVRRDRAITDPYEPGSTIKPFIVGPALQWHLTRPEEMFHLGGKTYITPYGRHISDVHGYDQLCLWDVLVKSSNIGMSMLGERLGNTRLHTALSSWNYGKPTGVELPGENGGKLNRLSKWNYFSTESVSQGYEIMVTPMQLCRAFCGYANGGYLVTPHIVEGTVDADGNVIDSYPQIPLEKQPRVIDAASAAEVKRILCDVPIRGTAANGKVRSLQWNIFGKTGTAHISEGKKGYSLTRFNSSFIAGAPAEDPRLVIAYIIHDPSKEAHYGGDVAGPGASQVLQRSLAYLGVPKSPDLPMPPDNVMTVLSNFKPAMYSREPKTHVALAE
jgi:cell division protein FtsI/penicillin-binding protein 2